MEINVLGGVLRASKQTKKLMAAVSTSKQLTAQILHQKEWTQEELYTVLQCTGYEWDSKQEEWKMNQQTTKPAATFIKMRLVFNSHNLERESTRIQCLLEKGGYHIVDCSKPYVRRPPEHLDSSVYLTIAPPPPKQ